MRPSVARRKPIRHDVRHVGRAYGAMRGSRRRGAPSGDRERVRSADLRPRHPLRRTAAVARHRTGLLAGRARGGRLARRAGVLGRDPLRRRPARPAQPGRLLVVAGGDADPRPRPGRSAVHPPDDPEHGPAGAGPAAHAGDRRVHPSPPGALRGAGARARGAAARHRRPGRILRPAVPGHRRLPAAEPVRPARRAGRGPGMAAALDEPGDRLPGPGARRDADRRGREAGQPALACRARGHVRLRPGPGRAQARRARRRRDDRARRGGGGRSPADRRRAPDVLLPAGDRRQRHGPQRAARRRTGARRAPGRVRRATGRPGPAAGGDRGDAALAPAGTDVPPHRRPRPRAGRTGDRGGGQGRRLPRVRSPRRAPLHRTRTGSTSPGARTSTSRSARARTCVWARISPVCRCGCSSPSSWHASRRCTSTAPRGGSPRTSSTASPASRCAGDPALPFGREPDDAEEEHR